MDMSSLNKNLKTYGTATNSIPFEVPQTKQITFFFEWMAVVLTVLGEARDPQRRQA